MPTLLIFYANCGFALCIGHVNQSIIFNSNVSNSHMTNRTNSTNKNIILPQSYYIFFLYHGYESYEEKKVYQVDNNFIKDQLPRFYIILEIKEKDVIYSKKDFDKIVVNFIRIELLYTKYYSTLFFQSKPHNYFKASWLEVTLSIHFS